MIQGKAVGPLSGLRVIEMASIGPVPHMGMVLSDLGADVIRLDRMHNASAYGANPGDITGRGRRSVALNLKTSEGVDAALQLLDTADVLIEGMRPGVMEKLGLGPDVCCERNPRLVYGRVSGWGQEGPLAQTAGHDINYIAITGLLAAVGRRDGEPVPPLNMMGDFAGGALYGLIGVLAALLERQHSGLGQVVDAAISDGVFSLLSCIHGLKAVNFWDLQRESNILDGGAHYYSVYQCKDGHYISLGAIEPQFYKLLHEMLELPFDDAMYMEQLDKTQWPKLKQKFAKIFKTRTRQQWCELLEGTDVCFAPVLDMDEAAHHPHNIARANLIERDGVLQSAPAPRFSRTPGSIQGSPVDAGANSDEILAEMGLTVQQISDLRQQGIVK